MQATNIPLPCTDSYGTISALPQNPILTQLSEIYIVGQAKKHLSICRQYRAIAGNIDSSIEKNKYEVNGILKPFIL